MSSILVISGHGLDVRYADRFRNSEDPDEFRLPPNVTVKFINRNGFHYGNQSVGGLKIILKA